MAGHEVKIRIIKSVSEGTLDMIRSRMRDSSQRERLEKPDAVALVHGDICDILFASDVALKAAGVEVFEIIGNCPQHMVCIGVAGDTSAVEAAVEKIREAL